MARWRNRATKVILGWSNAKQKQDHQDGNPVPGELELACRGRQWLTDSGLIHGCVIVK